MNFKNFDNQFMLRNGMEQKVTQQQFLQEDGTRVAPTTAQAQLLDINAILEKINKGDILSALTELGTAGIATTVHKETFTENGKTKERIVVEFSYNGQDYKASFVVNSNNKDEKPNVVPTVNPNATGLAGEFVQGQFGQTLAASDFKTTTATSAHETTSGTSNTGATEGPSEAEKAEQEKAEQARLQAIYDAMEAELKADLDKEFDAYINNYSYYGFPTKPSAEAIAQIKAEIWQNIQTQINTLKDFLKGNCASAEDYVNSANDENGAITNAYQTTFDAMVDQMSASLKKYGAEAKAKAEAEAAEASKNKSGAYNNAVNVISHYTIMGSWTTGLPATMSGAVGLNFTLQGNNKTIFDQLLKKIVEGMKYDNPTALDTIGRNNLEKLLQTAWTFTLSQKKASYNTSLNTTDFVNDLMKNYSKMLGAVATDPDRVLNIYFNPNCGDSSLINGIDNYYTNVNYKKYTKYIDGSIHLNDDNSDKAFQKAMNKLLENIYAKYSNIDKAYLKEIFLIVQEEGVLDKINERGIVSNAGGTTIGALCQQILSIFDRYIVNNAENLVSHPRVSDTTASVSPAPTMTNDRKNEIKTAVSEIKLFLPDVSEVYLLCKSANNNNSDFDMRFGVNKAGELIFANSNTKSVYDALRSKVKSDISKYLKVKDTDALAKFGGEAALDGLIRSAWVAAYSLYNTTTSTSQNLETFIKKVMENLNKMLTKIEKNPELLEVFIGKTSYADSSITNGVDYYNTMGYGNDEKVIYNSIMDKNGNIDSKFIYADGSIHLSEQNDDKEYTAAMDGVLKRLISKYSSVSQDIITDTFREAQKAALRTARTNGRDCPYGTTGKTNGQRYDNWDAGRVEDGGTNIGKMSSYGRAGDNGYIDLDQLVQLTLYYFDKLILNKLMN